jgi:flagellar protein FlaG
MDSKGIELPGINPLIGLQIQPEKKQAPAIQPVERTGKGKFRTAMDRDRAPALMEVIEGVSRNREEQAQLAADVLAEELQRADQLEITWTTNEVTGLLVVQVKDKITGEVLRQIPPEEILRGISDPAADISGLLLNKTA